MHQFFVTQDLQINTSIELSKDIAFQIGTVLKLKTGETVLICDQKKMFEASLILNGKIVSAHCEKEIFVEPIKIKITLIQALIRREKFELILQKATELGVDRIVPLILERNVVKWENEPDKMARYRSILKEAAEQCHRLTIPEIVEPIHLRNIQAYKSELNFVAYEVEDPDHQLKKCLRKCESVSVIIGPEGGISPKEIEMLSQYGFDRVSLGNRIYRAETAAMVAINTIDCVLDL
jgi:16S rRNA (uracil1498-N3)-methyltransferase